MRTNRTSIRTALGVSTALLLAPATAMAAELTYIETDSLEVGDKVFRPDAVAFSANGQNVTCAEVAFHIAKTQPACFYLLSMVDIREIARLAEQGSNFTTAGGLSFAIGPDGIVGLTEEGQSFAVASGSPAPGSTADDMTEDEIAAFLGLDSAAQLGEAAAGLGTGATAGTGGVSGSGTTSTGTGGTSASVSGSAGTSSGGTGLSGSGSTSASTGSGGTSVGVDADVDGSVGGTGVGVDAGASAGIGG